MKVSKETWVTSVPMVMLAGLTFGVIVESVAQGYHRNPVLDTFFVVFYVLSNYFWFEHKARHQPRGEAEQTKSSA